MKNWGWGNNLFRLDAEKRKAIIEKFSISGDLFDALSKHYNRIKEGMKKQYLAHMIRTMEIQLQGLTENPFFKITVTPMPSASKDLNIACASYQKNCFFSIYYPAHLDDKQLRVCLAHELGHLYLIEYANNALKNVNFNEKSDTEPLSTIFGILAILDKNDFYATVKGKRLMHKTWEDILKDFELLNKRKKQEYNIS